MVPPTPLHAGMTVTDEPGIYVEREFGVRIENTLLITPYQTTPFGQFLQFEPLTLCPIDLTPADQSLLDAEEKAWLNGYHQLVRERLSPYLSAEERLWLNDAGSDMFQERSYGCQPCIACLHYQTFAFHVGEPFYK